jgi:glycerol kinase
MLYDIHKGRWSRTICDLFDIPMPLLPEVRDCAADFGHARRSVRAGNPDSGRGGRSAGGNNRAGLLHAPAC